MDNLRLAVAAPRGIELQQDVLVIVDDEILVRVRHDDGHGALLGLRDRLRLDAGLNLAIENVLDELANILGLDLLGLVVGILGVLLGVLDGKGRELFGVKVKVAGVGTEHLGVNGGDVDGTLVLLGDGLEVLGVLLTLLLGLGENVGQRNAGLEWVSQVRISPNVKSQPHSTASSKDQQRPAAREKKEYTYSDVVGVGVGAELTNQRSAGGLHPVEDSVLFHLALVDGLLLIEILVQNQRGLLNSLSLGDGGITGRGKEVLVPLRLGKRCERLIVALIVGVEVANDHNLIHRLDLLQVVLGHGGDCGEGLLHHVRHESTASHGISHGVRLHDMERDKTYASAWRAPW